jgi:hypothetical protein
VKNRFAPQSAKGAARTSKSVSNTPARHPSGCRRVAVSRVHDFLSSSNVLLAALSFAGVPQKRKGCGAHLQIGQ